MNSSTPRGRSKFSRLTLLSLACVALLIPSTAAYADDPSSPVEWDELEDVQTNNFLPFQGLVPEVPESSFYTGNDGQRIAIDGRYVQGVPLGETHTWVWELDPNTLTPDMSAELTAAGIDLDADSASPNSSAKSSPQNGSTLAPPEVSEELLRDAGDCDVQLGDVLYDRLVECAAAAAAAGEPTTSSPESLSMGESAVSDSSDYPSGVGIDYSDEGVYDATSINAAPPGVCSTPTTGASVKVLSRFQACHHKTDKFIVLQFGTGKTIGSATMSMVTTISTINSSTSAAKFINNTAIKFSNRTGVLARTINVAGTFVCQSCTKESGVFNQGVGATWSNAVATVNGTPSSGQTKTPASNWKFNLSVPGVVNVANTTAVALKPRCDNNVVASMGKGCVIQEAIPRWAVPSTTPAVKAHVSKAIASGLPSTLSRLHPSGVAANRNKACRTGVPAANPGYTCDEYPMASTRQGAAMNGGTVRVPSGCIYPAVSKTGSSGWSRCQVPAAQNTSAGTALGTFYYNNRILPGDRFKVYA